MARIIKGQRDLGGVISSSPPHQESIKYAEGGRIIDKDFYRAQLLARDILKEGELARRMKLEAARRTVAQTKEEASADSAAAAFNETGKKAIEVFTERACYLADVSIEVSALATEIVKKILGGPLQLDEARQREIVDGEVRRLRAKRKLTLQCGAGTLNAMQHLAPDVLKRAEKEPDIELEEINDIKTGYFRIVTDAGSALCHQEAALTALQQSFYE